MSLIKKVIAGTTAVTGGWIAYSRLGVDHDVALPKALEADLRLFESPVAGPLAYYVDKRGQERPLLLLHSINAAASAIEMKPLFDYFRGQRPVYALDLPGFGFSDRSDRYYSAALYVNAITDFLKHVVGEAADIVALSLSSEFAATAALAQPDLVHSLALISPSGLGDREVNIPEEALYQLFAFPVWSQAFYDLLATRPSIRYFLQQSFVGDVPDELIDYGYATAHQPGARYAPLYFVSGRLFRRDVRTAVYEKLSMPTLVLHDKDPYVSFARLPGVLAANPNWRAEVITLTLGLPQWEYMEETAAKLTDFWQVQASKQASTPAD